MDVITGGSILQDGLLLLYQLSYPYHSTTGASTSGRNPLHMAFVAITKKCPLACEHCFEWDNLNKREKLSLSDLKKIVYSLQEKKIAQIHFSGGEPMLRVQDMLEVLQTAKPGTDFWVITSGYNFTAENAFI